MILAGSGPLAPPLAEAPARPNGRLAVACGRRFFVLLAVGLVWLVPALADARLGYAMLAWDLLLAMAWGIDLTWLVGSGSLSVRRQWQAPLGLGVPGEVSLEIVNRSRVPLIVTAVDTIPTDLRAAPPRLQLRIGSNGSASGQYVVQPTRRGDIAIGPTFLRCQSALGLAERWLRADLEQTVRVYPNIGPAARDSLHLVRSRRAAAERRQSRQHGAGREFDALREYQVGDEFRNIYWPASARRAKLVTRTFRAERSQAIWLVLDCGRLMRGRIGHLSKLDHAANAALELARVALFSGDRVGLMTYGRGVRHRIPAGAGTSHLHPLLNALALAQGEAAEADHVGAAARLLADQSRRSLVVWMTDMPETAMTPEVVEAVSCLSPKHLVLFVVIGQPDLEELAAREPSDTGEMFRVAAAQELVHRREVLLGQLRQRGVLAMETDAANLSSRLVNSYLEIKDRGRL